MKGVLKLLYTVRKVLADFVVHVADDAIIAKHYIHR